VVAIIKASATGRVEIPAVLRKQVGIGAGTYVRIVQTNSQLVLEPLDHDPISAARGMFCGLGPGTAGLEQDRRQECELEEADLPEHQKESPQ